MARSSWAVVVLFSPLFFLISFQLNAANRYAVATGNWNATSTWSATSGGAAGASVPVAGDNVFIEGNRTVTVTATAACANVTVSAGSTLTIGGFNITITGTTTVRGTVIHTSTTGTKTMGTVLIEGGTWTSNAAETYAITGLTLSNALINGTSTGVFTVGTGGLDVPVGTSSTVNAATLTITGATTINGSLTFAAASGTKSFYGAFTVSSTGSLINSGNAATAFRSGISNSGTFTPGTGTCTFSTNNQTITSNTPISFGGAVAITGAIIVTNAVETLTIAGNLTGSVAGSTWLNQGNSTLNLGNAVMATGVLNASASGCTVNYYRANTQTIKTGTYHNLVISGSSTKTLGGNITVNGNLSVQAGSLATSSFQITGNPTGTFEMLSGTTLTIGTTTASSGFPANFIKSNIQFNANSTVNYNSNLVQTISSVPDYGNLTLTAAAAVTKTADGDLNVGRRLTINTSNTLDGGTNTITVAENIVNNGTHSSSGNGRILLSGGSATHAISGASCNFGTLEINDPLGATLTGTGTTTLNGNLLVTSGLLTINAVTTALVVNGLTEISGTLNHNSTTGTKTFRGLIDIKANGSWTNTANESFTISGGITNAGTFTSGTGVYTFNTNDQELNGPNPITFSGTGSVVAISGAISLTNYTTVSVAGSVTGSVAGSTWINNTNSVLNVNGTMLTTGILTATASPNLVNYSGAAQTVKPAIYHDLSLSGSSAKTLTSLTTINNDLTLSGTASATTAAALTIGGDLTIGSGTGLTVPGFNFTVSGVSSISGTHTHSSATGTKTYSGNVTLNNGGVWNETAAAILNFGSDFQNDGTLTANIGVHTFTGSNNEIRGTNPVAIPNVTINGSYTNQNTLTVSTSLTGTGTLIQAANKILNMGGTSTITNLTASATGNTVNYTGAAQTIKATDYFHLSLQGSGIKTLPASTLNIAGDLSTSGTNSANAAASIHVLGSISLGNGTSFNAGSFTHQLSGNWTNNTAGFNASGSTFEFVGSLPQSISGSVASNFYGLRLNNASSLSLGTAVNANTLSLSSGILTSSASSLITVTGTSPGSVSGSSSSYVSGPVAITLPASLVNGTYSLPIGKSAYQSFDLVNVNTNSGGPVVVKAEVFDANCGGTAGTGMSDINANRYWESSILSGASNFTNTQIRLLDGAMSEEYAIGQSAVKTGAYDRISSIPPSGNTILSDVVSSLDFFVIGKKPIVTITKTADGKEGGPNGQFRISTTRQFVVDRIINITISGTATNGTDYTLINTTVTFPAFADFVNVPVVVTDDAFVEALETVIITLETGVGYALGIPVSATVNIEDNDVAGITVSPTSGLVTTEAGGTATFTVVLTSQPSADVTIGLSSSNIAEGSVSPSSLVFTQANWNVLQTVTITGQNDLVQDGNIAYTIITAPASSTDNNYKNLNPADVSVINLDDDVAGITVNPVSGLTTTEAGGTATFTIVLTSQPTASVSIGLSSSNTSEGTVSPASVTFTTANWNTPRTITVTGVNDFMVDGNIGYTIITAPATSTDPNYNGRNAADVSVTNIDNDVAGILVAPISGLITSEAGGTASFTIVLRSQPSATVTIPISSDDTSEGTVSPASVTFTSLNWNIPQTVTVTGVDDQLDDGDITYHIITGLAISTDPNYSGLNPEDVTVVNNDNDVAGISVSPVSGLVTSEAGGTASFTIVLNTQPTADVTIGLSSSNPLEGTLAVTSVTFTPANWNVQQSITITGVNDFIDDGDVIYTIITEPATSTDLLYHGFNPPNVSVTNTDDDTAGIEVSPISGLTVTEAGGSDTFTIRLLSQPTADVVIGFSSGDLTEGTVSVSPLTFTPANWNVAQQVTVTGVNDDVDDDDIDFLILVHAAVSADGLYNGMDPADVQVTNLDDDQAGVTVSPVNGLVTTEEGGTATFTIKLNSEPVANVIINLSSSDPTEGTVSPTSLTFSPANWNIAQTVTITGMNDFVVDGNSPYTILTVIQPGADVKYNVLNPDDVSVVNNDNDVAGFTVNPTSGLVTTEAGGTATFTIALTSQPESNVTVGLSSSNTNEGTVSPASVVFSPANWNIPQTVTITGVNEFIQDGNIVYSIITAAAISSDPNYQGLNPPDVSVTNLDNDVAGIVVNPTSGLITYEDGRTASFSLVLTSQPIANVTISISSSDVSEGIVSQSSVTFSPGNWNIQQTITIQGVDDFVADGNIPYTIVLSPAVSSDPNYSGKDPADVQVTNYDDDVAGIIVNAGILETTEGGGTASFTIGLTSQPTATVTLGISVTDPTEGSVSPSTVVFDAGNWNVIQTIQITGLDDPLIDGNISYAVRFAAAVSTDGNYSGRKPADLPVVNIDNDVAEILVDPVSGLETTEDGGTATFTIVLSAMPTASVTISLSSGNTAEGTVSPSAVSFLPAEWNIPKLITVTGVDDLVDDDDIIYTIITGAATSSDIHFNGINPPDVEVTNRNNDVAGITVSPTSGLITTEAGGTASFSIVLNSRPTANVSIGLSSDKTSEGTVSPASVVFTPANWNIARQVTITGVDDFVSDGDVQYTIVTAPAVSTDPKYSGLDAEDVSVTNTDNDFPGISVTPTSGLITTEAGGPAIFSVVLLSQPDDNVTIAVSSSNTAEGTVSTSLLTFTPSNWSVNQNVTITGVNDSQVDGDKVYTIILSPAVSTDSDYNGLDPDDVSVTNKDLTPTVSGFNPSAVCYGSGASVVISGTHFVSVTAVRINGLNAAYTVNNSSQITATLPATASSGTISVVTFTGTANSASAITVHPVSVGGTVSGSKTLCAGNTSGLLTLSGHTGTVLKWQSAVSPFSSWTDITHTSSTYTSGTLTETTRFRAVVQSGTCNTVFSTEAVVTIDPLTLGGTVSGGSTVCAGSTSGTLSLSGHNGTILKWQSAVSPFSIWTDIPNTSAFDTSGILAETTRFRAVVQSGICSPENSVFTTVTVTPLPEAPTGNAIQSFCTTTIPTVADLAASGSNLKWYAASSGGSALPASTALADGAHYYASQTVAGCESATRLDVRVEFYATGTWLGTTSTDWHTASNWCGAAIPEASTNVLIPAGAIQPVIYAAAVCNNLTIGSGATLAVSGTNTLTVSGNWLNSGTFSSGSGTVFFASAANQSVQSGTFNHITIAGAGSKTLSGVTVNGTLNMAGNAVVSGTPVYGPNAALVYSGTTSQTTGDEFPATFSGNGGVTINNTGGVSLNSNRTIASTLILTSGVLTTGSAQLLSISNSSNTAISGASAGSFISGPVRWILPSNLVSGTSYQYPTGKGTDYLPFTLVNPTTGSGVVSVQLEAFNSDSGGTPDGSSLDYISPYEYWSMVTSGNFTNSSVSLARQSALEIDGWDVIGASGSAAGTYSMLGGTVGTYEITNSDPIGSNRFFTFAFEHTNRKCPVNTLLSPADDQEICVGSPANELVANVVLGEGRGNPAINYQWYYNTSDSKLISGATKIVGATSQNYLPLSGSAEEGTTRYYFCVAYAQRNGCNQSDSEQSLASEPVKVAVKSYEPVSVSISASPSGPVCAGTSVSYTATAVNGGDLPTYQWQVNGTNVGTNSNTLVYVPADGDVVTCILQSSAACVVGDATVQLLNFTWDDSSKALTDSDFGMDASSIYSGQYVAGGIGGTSCLAPVSKAVFASPDVTLAFDGSRTELNGEGIDCQVAYRRDESVGQLLTRGNSLVITGGSNLSVSYRIDNGSGSYTTVNSGNVYAIPADGSFHTYRFRYSPSDGIGRLWVDGDEKWSSAPTAGQVMYWIGAGNLIVGVGIDASGNETPTFDNLSLSAVYSSATSASETMTVIPDNTISLTSAAGTNNQHICISSSITTISYATTGAIGAVISGLPTGISGSWENDAITISGTSDISGTFNYQIELTGGCGTITETGTIQIDPLSIAGTVTASSLEVCHNTSTTLSLSGYVGAIQWQQFLGGNWTDISGATADTYTSPNLSSSAMFRARVISGNCAEVFSNSIEVTVDTKKPVFSNCPADIVQNIDYGMCSALVSWTAPTVSDLCDGTLTPVISLGSGGSFYGGSETQATIAVGTTTVVYTATDSAGNIETCSFTIVVKDLTAPTITCPPSQDVFCEANIPVVNTLPLFISAGGTYTDNAGSQCELVTVQAADVKSGSQVTRTYTITDGGLNESVCTQVFNLIQPLVEIQSLNTSNTCIGGALNIQSDNTGYFYRWEHSTDQGTSWTQTGTDSPSFSGTLSVQGELFRLLVSESGSFTDTECVAVSNVLTFRENTAPAFIDGSLPDQTLCTVNGASEVAVDGAALNNLKVVDNCTVFANLITSYTLSGARTGSGINLAEGELFPVGTTTVAYTVTDEAGISAIHSFVITVKQSPAPVTLQGSVVQGGGTAILPEQCGEYNYRINEDPVPEAGFTYNWNVYRGQGTTGELMNAGIDYLIEFSESPYHAASVKISWTGKMTPGFYTIALTKSGTNGCASTALLEVNLQNRFNLAVVNPGEDCKGESLGSKIINWEVLRNCGSSTYSFTYVIAEGQFTSLADAQANAVVGPLQISSTTNNPTVILQTVNYGQFNNFYANQVFTLFIYNQTDSNGQADISQADDYQYFHLKAIPETSEITTD